jgi:SAM-dependent methyltransferase
MVRSETVLRRRFLTTILSRAAPGATGKRYLTLAQARPVLAALEGSLPAELRNAGERAWTAWVAAADRRIRNRVSQGIDDAVVNLLLYGVSFTSRPPLNSPGLSQASDEAVARNIQARFEDFLRALAAPAGEERLLLAGKHVRARARDPRRYLLENLTRVRAEQEAYAARIASAQGRGSATMEFAERSRLYRDRGLSWDTSLAPNHGIEESLRALWEQGRIAPGSIRTLAIVGPGLDFADKQSGWDFYPVQSIQPFALLDSLFRLGLAGPGIELTTFDVNPQVTAHLAGARRRAAGGYRLHLPMDPAVSWTPGLLDYWRRFGDRIGAPASARRPPPALGKMDVRAVQLRADVMARLKPLDLNIVVEAEDSQFDLVVATNVLLYFDTLEQALAVSNIEHMLRPGGVLLSNNAVLEIPGSELRSIGYRTVVYSDRSDDGDHIVWYRRAAIQP